MPNAFSDDIFGIQFELTIDNWFLEILDQEAKQTILTEIHGTYSRPDTSHLNIPVNAPESGSENQSSPTSIVADVNKVSNEYYK